MVSVHEDDVTTFYLYITQLQLQSAYTNNDQIDKVLRDFYPAGKGVHVNLWIAMQRGGEGREGDPIPAFILDILCICSDSFSISIKIV